MSGVLPIAASTESTGGGSCCSVLLLLLLLLHDDGSSCCLEYTWILHALQRVFGRFASLQL
jgi:hypothetical protein